VCQSVDCIYLNQAGTQRAVVNTVMKTNFKYDSEAWAFKKRDTERLDKIYSYPLFLSCVSSFMLCVIVHRRI